MDSIESRSGADNGLESSNIHDRCRAVLDKNRNQRQINTLLLYCRRLLLDRMFGALKEIRLVGNNPDRVKARLAAPPIETRIEECEDVQELCEK